LQFDFLFFFNNILLGVGLAMDAFSVSLANGLNEPCMKKRKMCAVAGVFAFFQAFMPMIGWVCIHTIVKFFKAFEKLIPWIALILLCYIGGKLIYDSLKCQKSNGADHACAIRRLSFGALIMQAVATSIDALSVGFTIANYIFVEALLAAFLIAAVTFIICFLGIAIGKKAGTKLAEKAEIIGGCILIFIGIEIFVSSFI